MTVRCDYCDEGNLRVDGWHYYPGDEFTDGYRVPCSTDPPRSAKIITDPSVLTYEEKLALLRVNEYLGPVRLDVEGGIRGGDFL